MLFVFHLMANNLTLDILRSLVARVWTKKIVQRQSVLRFMVALRHKSLENVTCSSRDLTTHIRSLIYSSQFGTRCILCLCSTISFIFFFAKPYIAHDKNIFCPLIVY